MELTIKSDSISTKITKYGFSLKTRYFGVGTPSEEGIIGEIDQAKFGKSFKPIVGLNKTYKESRMAVLDINNNYAFVLIGKENSIGYIRNYKKLSFGFVAAFSSGRDNILIDDWMSASKNILVYPAIQYRGRYLSGELIGVFDSNLCQKYKVKIEGDFHGFSFVFSKGMVPNLLQKGDGIETRFEGSFKNDVVTMEYLFEEGPVPVFSFDKRTVHASMSVLVHVGEIQITGKSNAVYGKKSPKITENLKCSWKEWSLSIDEKMNPSISFSKYGAAFNIGKEKNETSISLRIEKDNWMVLLKASSKKILSMECTLDI